MTNSSSSNNKFQTCPNWIFCVWRRVSDTRDWENRPETKRVREWEGESHKVWESKTRDRIKWHQQRRRQEQQNTDSTEQQCEEKANNTLQKFSLAHSHTHKYSSQAITHHIPNSQGNESLCKPIRTSSNSIISWIFLRQSLNRINERKGEKKQKL